MREPTIEQNGDNMPDPTSMSEKFQAFIIGKVSTYFTIPVSELTLDHNRAFIGEDNAETYFFYVYDRSGVLYGVTAQLDQDGTTLADYRCQKILQ